MKHNKNLSEHENNIPKDTLEFIDLEQEVIDTDSPTPETIPQSHPETPETDITNQEEWEGYYEEEDSSRTGIYRFLNLHVLLAVVIVAVIAISFFRLKNWGEMVDLDEIFKDGPGTYEDNFDEIVPLLDANSKPVQTDELDTIVAFGNAPFSDDRDSEDNLANMIGELTEATVYNCSVPGSYMACDLYPYDHTLAPMDAYSFFWLASLAAGVDKTEHFNIAKETLQLYDKYPEIFDEVYETLTTLDFNTVDAILIMYDAADYYKGHSIFNSDHRDDITSFSGALVAGVEMLQSAYPHIRIIVMSPAYAYAVDEEGNYVSSDQYTYGVQDVFSSYTIKQCAASISCNVSFIDNLYGTITEDNAKDYLIDNVHLNVEGRKLIAERCEYFLNYYIKGYGESE